MISIYGRYLGEMLYMLLNPEGRSHKADKRIKYKMEAFIEHHQYTSSPIVCITSGGTIVPLEKNMVRFIDNFSQGNRGAISAEYFLSKGYAVIYLYRKGTKTPFTRAFSHEIGETVDSNLLLKVSSSSADNEIVFKVSSEAKELIELESSILQNSLQSKRLVMITFETVQEYLAQLQVVAERLAPFGPRACFYLAAAVSDFYIPEEDMLEHKIQSSGGGLALELAQVPKRLGVLRQSWAPHAFIVSFKLETDNTLLLHKVQRAIVQYGVHCVVGNLLHLRKAQCILVTPARAGASAVGDFITHLLDKGDHMLDLEQMIVERISALHVAHLRQEFATLAPSQPGAEKLLVGEIVATRDRHRDVRGERYFVALEQLQARPRGPPPTDQSYRLRTILVSAVALFAWTAFLSSRR